MARKSKPTLPAAPVYKVPRLNDREIDAGLHGRPEWSLAGDAIQRTFAFKNFLDAMAFVNRAAAVAEADQHHPDVLIRYNKVTLTLSTHDAGGISAKDFSLAAKLDQLV